MKSKLLLLLFIASLLFSCSREDDFIFEKRLIRSYENTYDKNKLLFFFNNDSSISKIEHYWLDTIRITYDFFYNENKEIFEINNYTSEFLFFANGVQRLPFNKEILLFYNVHGMVDSIIFFNKASSEILEKTFIQYSSDSIIVKIINHYIQFDIVRSWDVSFKHGNVTSMSNFGIQHPNQNQYDSKTNPFYSLKLPAIDISLLSYYDILSKNNATKAHSSYHYNIDYFVFKYRNNYPTKKMSLNNNAIYIYDYY